MTNCISSENQISARSVSMNGSGVFFSTDSFRQKKNEEPIGGDHNICSVSLRLISCPCSSLRYLLRRKPSADNLIGQSSGASCSTAMMSSNKNGGSASLDLFSTALFLFCGRRRDRIKSLLWEYDVFLLVSFLIFQTKPTPRS